MKSLLSKVIILIAGVAALFGMSVTNVTAISPASNITGKSALYLEHGKSIGSNISGYNDHESHYSHESHRSHYSHYSGYN